MKMYIVLKQYNDIIPVVKIIKNKFILVKIHIIYFENN